MQYNKIIVDRQRKKEQELNEKGTKGKTGAKKTRDICQV